MPPPNDVSVSGDVRLSPFIEAVTFTVVVVDCGLVGTGAMPDVAPAAMVMVAGTGTALLFELASVTTAPPEGAAAVSVTIAVILAPPTMLVGASAKDESIGAACPVVPVTSSSGE